MKKLKLVVIGNGMAGMRTVEELLKLAPDLYDITVFGAEPHGNYNRILLSPVLAGESSFSEILLNSEVWYRENGITLYAGKEVVEIDRRHRKVIASDGTEAQYDRLLIATGSKPIALPIPGATLPGVVGFRTIRDVEMMLEASRAKGNAVVIGGGLLGLEAAAGLMKQGMSVSVIHLMNTLMDRQLDEAAAAMLRRTLEARGLKIFLSANTEQILGEERVRAVRLADGTEIPTDLVVMAVGIRPDAALAKAAGLHCERGIVTNDTMQTFDPRIYAVGECVQHRGRTYGLVAPLFEQAKVCANQLALLGHSAYRGSTDSARLKVADIDLFSAGDFREAENADTIVLHDLGRGIYKKLVLADNRIRGVVLYGDAIDASWYYQLLCDGVDVSGNRDRLLFGKALAGDAGRGAKDTFLELSDDTEICGCNGVCKKTIVDAITEKKLFTLEEVRAHTKASSSCGSCTGLVKQILAHTLGSDFSEGPTKKPLCACTEYSHDEVRSTIREEELKSIGEAMVFLEWKTTDGCAACRQALNYYLHCAWPGEYEHDAQSRFINERAHANIQKDGSYSVIPRMWGGMTTVSELRAIADVAEKHSVPALHITGGQRIDLLGVKKEVLPEIWRDLNDAGMVSGYAYAKAVRTVKTCVGKQWCRFGTQDSTAMGIEIEKMTWGAWAPHKVKLAVSGCPRNCAEATIKDFGVVAVDSGWELHVGGNGGVKVRATDFLCKVATEAEVLETCGAFLQMYREEAHYLERTAAWIERVGLAAIRKRIVDDATGRKVLYERFLHSQKFSQKDPWAERAREGVEAHEFKALTVVTKGEAA